MSMQRMAMIAVFVYSLALPARAVEPAVGTAFSYQGRLVFNGSPATGSFDFKFSLYNAATGGALIGSALLKNSVAVSGGVFNVTLDFGASPFAGSARWLEISVKTAGGPSYYILSPRQQLYPTPYALRASAAPWSGISGMPAGFADGTDNDTKYSAGTGLTLSGGAFSVKYGGSGAAATSARSDHNHWGIEWHGRDAGMVLSTTASTYMNPVTFMARTNAGSGNAISGIVTEDGTFGFVQKQTGVAGLNYGTQTGGYGVYGYASAANSYGVFGRATGTNPVGMRGESAGQNGIGVEGEATATGGTGVRAMGKSYGIKSSADYYGVYSLATGSNATGVQGIANTGSNAFGIWGVSSDGYAGYFSGKAHVNGALSKSSGSFLIDHPLDPARKYLMHSFVESPDMMNIYNGNATLDPNGEAVVTLPEWFGALNKDFRYQLTCIGGYAPVYVAEEVANNKFKIAGGRAGLKVSWQITGVRQDAWANSHRIQVESEKPAEEQGTYLYPEGFGKDAALGTDQARMKKLESMAAKK